MLKPRTSLALLLLPVALLYGQDPAARLEAVSPAALPEGFLTQAHDSGDPAYDLGPDDEITVAVLEAEEISGQRFRIGTDGHITIPLAGRFQVAGLTLGEFEAELTRRLKVYVHDPHVAVTITEFRSQPVSVIGAVKKPGVHQLRGRKTLVEILSLAEGLRDDAGHMVKITRRKDRGLIPLPNARIDPTGQFSVAEVSLEAVMEAENPGQNVIIEPHDVISVPRADLVYVIGAVKKAGGFVLHERENISVLQVLALAGGLAPAAATKSARILRGADGDGERIEIAINLKDVMTSRSDDPLLRRDDVLFIPISGGKIAATKAAEAALRIGTGIAIWGR